MTGRSDLVAALRRAAGAALCTPELPAKQPIIDQMLRLVGAPGSAPATEALTIVDPGQVGRSGRVTLVAPRDLKRRTWGSEAGRFATLHALAHIEANAVNLALDAVHRFDDMPEQYYLDWTGVAAEELSHFVMLEGRLAAHGGTYGDLGCHDGLWDIAVRTAHDVGARMALVPLVFEARGLDVTPGLIERFERHGDPASADVLRIVLRDEIGHVETGSRWFSHVCAGRGLDPTAEFERLVAEHSLLIVPPFNTDARVAAGFSPADLQRWEDRFVSSRRH